MYEFHPKVATPDRNTIIWRYMTFPKFVWLLAKQTLFFAAIDQLDDPWEGLTTQRQIDQMKQWVAKAYPNEPEIRNQIMRTMSGRDMCVNCWHMNTHESMGMWSLYGGVGSLAVQSTVGGLIDCLRTDMQVFIGSVNYEDRSIKDIVDNNMIALAFNKGIQFRDERELRAALWMRLKTGWNGYLGIGEAIPVDVATLVQSLVLAPQSKEWLFEAVKSVLERFGLNKVVMKPSVFDDRPDLDFKTG
jgi:hypothetical protein